MENNVRKPSLLLGERIKWLSDTLYGIYCSKGNSGKVVVNAEANAISGRAEIASSIPIEMSVVY